MATESTKRTPEQIAVADELGKLQYQAKAITDLIESATQDSCLSDAAIPGGCWALRDILDRLSVLIAENERLRERAAQ